jgi:hypothetical protein
LVKRDEQVEILCSYIPIFTSSQYGDRKYVVLPINENPIDPRNIRRRRLIAGVVGDAIEQNHDIAVQEYVEKIDTEKLDVKKIKKKVVDISRAKKSPVECTEGNLAYSIYRNSVCLTGIADESFVSSYSVADKIYDAPVETMSEGAFENNTVIKKINFNKDMRYISERAFKNCEKLEGFQLGRNVSEIKEEAFAFFSLFAVIAAQKNQVGFLCFQDADQRFQLCVSGLSAQMHIAGEQYAQPLHEGRGVCDGNLFDFGQVKPAEVYVEIGPGQPHQSSTRSAAPYIAALSPKRAGMNWAG